MVWNEEYKKKTECYLKMLPKRMYQPIAATEFCGFYTRERLSLDEAMEREKQPLAEGTRWGYKWEYGWFFTQVTIPKECEGKRILFTAQNGESLVFVNGIAVGALDREHTHITLTQNARAGETYQIAMEVYAGHGKGLPQDNYVIMVPEVDNSLLDDTTMQKTVKNGTFGVMQEEVFQLYMDLQILYNLSQYLDKDSLRRANIEQAIMEMCDCVDIELPMEEFLLDVKRGRDALLPALSCKNGDSMPTIYAIGHSHLDLEWLWTVEETRRKAARTLGNQLQLIEEYDNYQYIQTQPWILETVKHEYPEMYQRVKQAVKDGKIIIEGGMWVEADTNIPAGESLIRQFVYGKKFIEEEFGTDSTILWLPDVFGVSASMPQIMKGCGVDYFMNAKVSWLYNGGDVLPHTTFRWKGIDGSEVLSHVIMGYAAEMLPSWLIARWADNHEKADVSIKLFAYGHGDGGGGATRIHLEGLKRMGDLEGVPKVVSQSPNQFFRDVEDTCKVDKKFSGELYYAAHRGTYTAQAKTKKLNRKAELALRGAEIWSALLGTPVAKSEIDILWKDVLFTHFHDIIPGSSIGSVYEAAEKKYAEVIAKAEVLALDAAKTAIREQDDAITVFNSLSWERDAYITLPEGYTSLSDSNGVKAETQTVDNQTIAKVSLPSMGYRSFTLGKEASANVTADTDLVLENQFLRAEFNALGELICLYDKEKEMECLDAPSNRFRMYKDMPTFCDAWDIESFYEKLEVPLDEKAEVKVLYRGALMDAISITRKLHHSTLKQTVTLKKDSRVLEFQTEVDWQESHKLLKVEFATNIHTEELLSETQFGYVKRPTHKNRPYDADRFEVCQHKWSALCEGGRGLAILNDSKYGIGAKESTMSLTLLKSSQEPARDADKGIQVFTYGIMPYVGAFADSSVVREAYQLNSPPVCVKGVTNEKTFFTISAKNVIIDTVKVAEDGSGDLIVRLYECMNSYTNCKLSFGFPVKAVHKTDMLEHTQDELAVHDNETALSLKAFEVVTVRVKK